MAKVRLNSVHKTYPNGAVAVRGVNMEIEDGEFIVFVGPSGCGKSTLLRMIAGLEKITDGEINIDDKLINNVSCTPAPSPMLVLAGIAQTGQEAGKAATLDNAETVKNNECATTADLIMPLRPVR